MPSILATPIGYLLVFIIIWFWVNSPLFAPADASWHDTSERTSVLDGLRGVLALGVYFHHIYVFYPYSTGQGHSEPAHVYIQLGEGSVALFFMITGYLFWGKGWRAQGKLNWKSLYISRIFRIAPMYYVAILFTVLIVFASGHFILHQPLYLVIKQAIPLLFFGLSGNIHVLNAYQAPGTITAGVIWTLRYEWYFYVLILPLFTVLLSRFPKLALRIIMLGLLLCLMGVMLHQTMNGTALAYFLTGMLIVMVPTSTAPSNKPREQPYKSAFALLLIVLILGAFPTSYTALPIVLLGILFWLITSGASLFGMLHTRCMRRIGEISYSTYLLHGLILYAAFHTPFLKQFAAVSVPHYWIMIAGISLVLMAVSLAAHILIEKPGIRFGKIIIARFAV